ncbi:hypothetical protein BDP27DRAFT_1390928 [Rhodocollybia butyracea]|uniref:Calpain catalytic domain-containing protein n=1 Tax=Rhodocollybia butyracea TaxID=206335 RepID=A0A9P5Q2K6_9AGAR|nr:hypothetical protein BDP27DRAFT_1390928 [Rhodocollybia butyracea]
MQRLKDAESLYSKATKSELARDYDSAFRLYIKAAESFLHLSRSASETEKDKLNWEKNASKALERAERIKQTREKSKQTQNSGTSSQSDSAAKLTLVSVDYFSAEEQSYVLKKGGNVNGVLFPLWHEKPELSSTQRQPKLSELQSKLLAVWKTADGDVVQENHSLFPHDISQNIVTDCSVCASISSCIEHDRRFGSNLARSILYVSGSNSTYVYDLKLFYNGDWRRVRIDGQLPYHPTSGVPLCLTCKPRDTGEGGPKISAVSWPSILEKGYMVLMGGYDFPGSNSSIDLHTLTGWIPEHIDIKWSNFEGERTWTRILEGFTSGRCMLTLGTGPNPDIRWRNSNLLSAHSYAVTDLREDDTGRFVTVIDSWVHSESLNVGAYKRPDVLEIPWLDVLDIFDGIYLNWDPRMWSSNLTYHAMWRTKTDHKARIHQVRANLRSTGSEQGEIWVLLTRHINNTRKSGIFIACKVQVEDDEADYPFVSDKQQQLSNKGTYTNSPHVLIRTKITPLNHSASLSIFAMCEDPSDDIGFDITIYAPTHLALTWKENLLKFPFTETQEGSLTSKNSGGNSTHPSFMVNPQYHLRIHPSKQSRTGTKERSTFLVETNKDLPIQIIICWSEGERVTEPSQKNIVATSGKYTHGLAQVTALLSPGNYSVIISAFEPYQSGPYTLNVQSFAKFDIKAIPQEGAGMYRKAAKGAWDSSSAAGAPSFKRYFQNPIFELNLSVQSQIQIRLQLIRPSSSISLNVTVYSASENLSTEDHVLTSGPYDDPITGVVTPLTTLSKGRYWVVPSTYNPGTQAAFQLIVFSTLASTELDLRRS